MGDTVALLDREVYGMGQVDRLLGLSRGTACRWIDGYERRGRHYEPLVRAVATGSETVTWGEFVEARLISEYRQQGVSVFRMRPAIMALREEVGTDYPLAAAQPFLSTEGRELVLRVQQETNLQPSLRFVFRSGQAVLPSLEVRRFQQAADYEDAIVRRFRIADSIVIDPEYASGEPTIAGRRLRVTTVAESVVAGESRDVVAEVWDITPRAVDDAVRCSRVAQDESTPGEFLGRRSGHEVVAHAVAKRQFPMAVLPASDVVVWFLSQHFVTFSEEMREVVRAQPD